MPRHRRDLLKLGLGLGASLVAHPVWANTSQRKLSVLNLHTGERLQATYWADGDYIGGALDAFAKVLRDHRTGEAHPIAPGVLDIASTLAADLSPAGEVQIISGYRSPKTNAALHAASSSVATRSLHMDGMALDIRMPGVDLARLRNAALALRRGGVGFYPDSNFVHVDVGRLRRW